MTEKNTLQTEEEKSTWKALRQKIHDTTLASWSDHIKKSAPEEMRQVLSRGLYRRLDEAANSADAKRAAIAAKPETLAEFLEAAGGEGSGSRYDDLRIAVFEALPEGQGNSVVKAMLDRADAGTLLGLARSFDMPEIARQIGDRIEANKKK